MGQSCSDGDHTAPKGPGFDPQRALEPIPITIIPGFGALQRANPPTNQPIVQYSPPSSGQFPRGLQGGGQPRSLQPRPGELGSGRLPPLHTNRLPPPVSFAARSATPPGRWAPPASGLLQRTGGGSGGGANLSRGPSIPLGERTSSASRTSTPTRQRYRPDDRIFAPPVLLQAHTLVLEETNERRIVETDQRRALRRLHEQLEDVISQAEYTEEMRRMWQAVREATYSPSKVGNGTRPPPPPSRPAPISPSRSSKGGTSPFRAAPNGISSDPFGNSQQQTRALTPPRSRTPTSLRRETLTYSEPFLEAEPGSPFSTQVRRLQGEQRHSLSDSESYERHSLLHKEAVGRSAIITDLSTGAEEVAHHARLAQQRHWLEETKATYKSPREGVDSEGKRPKRPAPIVPGSGRRPAPELPSDVLTGRERPSRDEAAWYDTSASSNYSSHLRPAPPTPQLLNASSRALRDESLSAMNARLIALANAQSTGSAATHREPLY